MQGQWNHDRAYYRCRFRDDYAVGDGTHPKSVYVKEDAVIPGLDACLATLFDDDRIDDTCAALAGTPEVDHEAVAREARLRAGIAECDRKLAKYRALLDHEDAVEVAAKWIAETQRERKALERQLGQRIPGGKLTTEQVKALASALRDIVEVLAEADLDDKARLYSELGISLTLAPAAGIVHVRAHPRGVQVRVGGGTCGLTPRLVRVLSMAR
jgi:site-specific DNA recombinase